VLLARICAALVAALGAFVVVPVAGAATLTVDDDFKDCPAAQYQSVQNAIFAARPGDTVSICPGTYVEGGGGVGSNALIIVQDVTIKGAGADLVRITPRRTTPTGSRIAETTSPSLRNAVGAIVMVNGDYVPTAIPPNAQQYAKDKTKLTKVDISGVTIDGDGVYAEAGVVFRDAQGSVSNSRITNIVTTERSMDTPRPGEYKGSNDGIAIASVTAPPFTTAGTPDSAPLPATPRLVTVDHTRIERYNSAGVLLDGATGDTAPLTASGVVTKGTLLGNQIVGRTLCIDFEATGNCQQAGNPPPPLPVATNGPLYGQDGVRITAGSSATLTNNTITQNLVQGTNAPARGSTPQAGNNANLWLGAGVRLIGAGASVFSRNNLTDNAYGVYNAQLDGTTANTAVPVKAENNWWGLRTTAITTPNPGPAISPTTNPAVPENPVNGAPVADGAGTTSDAVDFFPFRDGLQSDPNTGEFPVIDVPGPVNDLAPTVTLSTDATTYHRGDLATLTAAPADDFGVHSVTFYDGAAVVGVLTTKPYRLGYRIPSDILCSGRTLTAVAEDSAGQTASASVPITIAPTDCAPIPGPTAPTLAFVNAPRRLDAKGATIAVNVSSSAGLKQVVYYLGDNKRCTATAAPWSCKVVPTGDDVGMQVLRAIATDVDGRTGEASARIEIPRFKPAGLSLSVDSADLSRNRVRKTIDGQIKLPSAVTAAQGCASGHVTVVIKRAGKIIYDEQEEISKKSCKFSSTVVTQDTNSKKAFSVSARFSGNDVLLPVTASRRFS
jgi:hypothetical protein